MVPPGQTQTWVGRSERVGEYRGELVHGPVDLLLGDHDRRSESQRRTVGVLNENAAFGQAQAELLAGADLGSMSTPAHRPRPRTATTPLPMRPRSLVCR